MYIFVVPQFVACNLKTNAENGHCQIGILVDNTKSIRDGMGRFIQKMQRTEHVLSSSINQISRYPCIIIRLKKGTSHICICMCVYIHIHIGSGNPFLGICFDKCSFKKVDVVGLCWLNVPRYVRLFKFPLMNTRV